MFDEVRSTMYFSILLYQQISVNHQKCALISSCRHSRGHNVAMLKQAHTMVEGACDDAAKPCYNGHWSSNWMESNL